MKVMKVNKNPGRFSSLCLLVFGLLLSTGSISAVTLKSRSLCSDTSRPVNIPLSMGYTKTSITSKGDYTYVVYADENRRPKIMRWNHATNSKSIAYLDGSDYMLPNDGHHGLSIGVDKNGYLHIVGDMHNYPYAAVSHLPSRYQNKNILYWKSTSPNGIYDFEFLGDDSSKCPPGTGFSYLSFINDSSGELYLYSRQHVTPVNSGGAYGKLGWGLAKYNGTGWNALGSSNTGLSNGNAEKVIFYEPHAVAGSHYQGYKGRMRFDSNDVLHAAVTVNDDDSNNGGVQSLSMTTVLYFYSDDYGVTWNDASGNQASLPLKSEDVTIVEGNTHWLNNETNLAIDNGKPLVSWRRVSDGSGRWSYLGSYGNFANDIATPLSGAATKTIFTDMPGWIYMVDNGDVWTASYWNQTGTTYSANPWIGGEVDYTALAETGEMFYIGKDSGGYIHIGELYWE